MTNEHSLDTTIHRLGCQSFFWGRCLQPKPVADSFMPIFLMISSTKRLRSWYKDITTPQLAGSDNTTIISFQIQIDTDKITIRKVSMKVFLDKERRNVNIYIYICIYPNVIYSFVNP